MSARCARYSFNLKDVGELYLAVMFELYGGLACARVAYWRHPLMTLSATSKGACSQHFRYASMNAWQIHCYLNLPKNGGCQS